MNAPVFPGKLKKNDAFFIYGALQKKPFVYVYQQSDLEIVLGPSCSAEKETVVDQCLIDGVSVVERRGGGGTVLLAPGMVITIIVGKRTPTQNALEIFDKIHVQMIRILNELGVCGVEKKGISDLAVNNKKILGSSLYMGKNPDLYYYQSSLMVQPEIELLSRYLAHPPREPDYRNGRNHKEFCTTLRNEGFSVTVSEICDVFSCKMPKYIQDF
ncbi:MAG: hypothetical protein GX640_22945 [Fibrobacter sp.]|nr:hypothetical protein [Fibrobacter sp.]